MNTTAPGAGTLRLLAASVVLAALFDILIYGSIFHLLPFGINVPLYILALYIAIAAVIGAPFLKGMHRFPLHIAFIVALALTFALYNNVLLLVINAILLVFLIGEQILLSLGMTAHAPYSIAFIGDSMVFWFALPFTGIKPAFKSYGEKGNARHMKGVLIGLIIAVPLIAAVLALLISADMAFNKILYDIFGDINWTDIVGNLLVGIGLFVFFSGLLWVLSIHKKRTAAPPLFPSTEQKKTRFNVIAAALLLVFLDIVLALFSLTQFLYLFAGRVPDGLSYAEYARTGFWQLLAVAGIVMLVLFLVLKFTELAAKKTAAVMRVLSSLLCGFTIIVLVSAFSRMVLYEQAYAFTVFRIITQFFMAALLLVLAFTLLHIWLPAFPLRKCIFIAGMACYTVLALFNLDGFIAKQNIRYQEQIDYLHLSSLSVDALPYYAGLLSQEDFTETSQTWDPDKDYRNDERQVHIDDGIVTFSPSYEMIIVARNLANMSADLDRSTGWQHFNTGRGQARQCFAQSDALQTAVQLEEGERNE